MRCLHCGECCKETEMLLSARDIEGLERRGYTKTFFVRFDQNGYATLCNANGYCVFFDRERRSCRERASRPLGCRIYPVMHDEEKGIVVDDICQAKISISEKEKTRRGKKVLKLLNRIDAEAAERRHQELAE